MSEGTTATATTDTAAPAAAEEENVFLLYIDHKDNPGPKEFVMHGVNLFFRRGAITGPVTSTVAGIVTGRKKPPLIAIASAEYLKEFQKSLVGADADKGNDDQANKRGDDSNVKSGDAGKDATSTSSDPKTEGDGAGDQPGSGSIAPPETSTAPATERKPKRGTTLLIGE